MTDYGHDLQFGTFITPSARDADSVVALAELSESAGLDLVTFQDHPYNADFLDTWTLMSWVAARTERIHLAGNVLNLPLRPPAMLARSAASLDLLSHGRFEMGIGSGAFWDPIAGMGVPKLTPGQGIAALSEAIDLMRAIWAESGSRRVRFSGEHYTVPGMQRGPVPAHAIDLWIGAYKPKMLRLTGEKANGWLPSLGYLDLKDAPASNATIDEAALAAGRNPREIRRLLNLLQGRFLERNAGFLQGPVEQWVEEIAELALEHGFGSFILPGDNPRTILTFAEDVVPAVRELVAKERARAGTDTSPVRPNAALALRREGIAYAALPDSLAGKAVEPGDFGYERARHTYMRRGSPGLVIFAESNADVVDALAFARAQGVPLSVRSGGHGISGRSTNDGGIVIDVSKMNRIDVIDTDRRLVRIEPGATWGEVAAALAPHGLAISSGDYGDVGVGGLATAGGIGFLVRKEGLTIDRMRSAELVLADGTLHRVDADTEPDLFWAIRGAGGNFGIVTAFEFEASEVGNVVFAILVADATNTAPLLEAWGRLVEEAPREVTSFATLVPESRDAPPIAQFIIVFDGDDLEAASTAITPFFTQLGPILQQQAQLLPYAAIVSPYDGEHTGQGLEVTNSGLATHITPALAQALESLLINGDTRFLQIRAAGGAVNDLPAGAMAWSHRHQNFSVSASTTSFGQARQARHWARIAPQLDGLYLSFETGTDPSQLERAFPEPALSRLRALKERYDPDNVFNQNFSLAPEAAIAL